MTDKMAIRTFPTAYKLKAIKRAEGGEGFVVADERIVKIHSDRHGFFHGVLQFKGLVF
jgi:hypothetical protein